MIKVHISRYNKEKEESYIETYEIEKKPKMKVLDALNEINQKYGADISFRSSCRAGQCGSCAVLIDGNPALGCKKEIQDDMLIEPLKLPIIKDLIVDRSVIDEKVEDMNLHLKAQDSEGIHPPETLKDTKKVRTCIECYSCLAGCPVYQNFQKDYAGPYFMRYLGKFQFDPREVKDYLKESFENGLYTCTSCGRCGEVCPKNINSFGDAVEKLRTIAYSKDEGPLDAHKQIKETILKTGRSINKKEESFIESLKDNNKKSKIALFTGCMVDYRLQNVGKAVLDVLRANNIEVDVPKGQVCCGSPLLRTGQRDIIEKLAKKNYETFKDYDTVLTICAGCGSTLKNDYPNFKAKLNVEDISEFLVDKLDYSKMKPINRKVTWHDPCHLRRGQNIINQPREIIKNIPGIEFEDLYYPNPCCGAGGGVKSGKPEIASTLSQKKAKLIKKTNSDNFITICPFCQSNISEGLKAIDEEKIKGMNLVELLQEAYSETT